MTKENKIKMWQWVGGLVTASLIAAVTFANTYGALSNKVDMTEKSTEKRFDKIDEALIRINKKLDDYRYEKATRTNKDCSYKK